MFRPSGDPLSLFEGNDFFYSDIPFRIFSSKTGVATFGASNELRGAYPLLAEKPLDYLTSHNGTGIACCAGHRGCLSRRIISVQQGISVAGSPSRLLSTYLNPHNGKVGFSFCHLPLLKEQFRG